VKHLIHDQRGVKQQVNREKGKAGYREPEKVMMPLFAFPNNTKLNILVGPRHL